MLQAQYLLLWTSHCHDSLEKNIRVHNCTQPMRTSTDNKQRVSLRAEWVFSICTQNKQLAGKARSRSSYRWGAISSSLLQLTLTWGILLRLDRVSEKAVDWFLILSSPAKGNAISFPLVGICLAQEKSTCLVWTQVDTCLVTRNQCSLYHTHKFFLTTKP